MKWELADTLKAKGGSRDLPMDLFSLMSASSKEASADDDGQAPHTLQPPIFVPKMPIFGPMPKESPVTPAKPSCGSKVVCVSVLKVSIQQQGCSPALGNGLG